MNRRRARSEATVGHIQNEFMLKFHGKANFVSKEGILCLLFSQNGNSNSTKSIQEGRGKTRKGRRRVVTESMASKSLGEMSLPRLSLPKSQNSTHSKPTVRLGKIGR